MYGHTAYTKLKDGILGIIRRSETKSVRGEHVSFADVVVTVSLRPVLNTVYDRFLDSPRTRAKEVDLYLSDGLPRGFSRLPPSLCPLTWFGCGARYGRTRNAAGLAFGERS